MHHDHCLLEASFTGRFQHVYINAGHSKPVCLSICLYILRYTSSSFLSVRLCSLLQKFYLLIAGHCFAARPLFATCRISLSVLVGLDNPILVATGSTTAENAFPLPRARRATRSNLQGRSSFYFELDYDFDQEREPRNRHNRDRDQDGDRDRDRARNRNRDQIPQTDARHRCRSGAGGCQTGHATLLTLSVKATT